MKILVFAPHNDDEVLGVGGTIAKYASEGHEVYVCEVTSGRNKEILMKEAIDAHKILGVSDTIFLDLPAVGLTNMPMKELNEAIYNTVNRIKPDIAFIPHKGDMHKDHKMVAESAMVALRPVNSPQLKAIYSYETLSETEWNIPSADNVFVPNVWVDISTTLDKKIEAMKCYKSQLYEFPHPRSLEAIQALAKFRGSTICVNYAESFMLIRSIQ